MKLERVQPGDVVRWAIKGRTGIDGEVTEIKDGIVYFPGAVPRERVAACDPCEVVGHWRKAGRRGGQDNAPLAPREQVSLPGVYT